MVDPSKIFNRVYCEGTSKPPTEFSYPVSRGGADTKAPRVDATFKRLSPEECEGRDRLGGSGYEVMTVIEVAGGVPIQVYRCRYMVPRADPPLVMVVTMGLVALKKMLDNELIQKEALSWVIGDEVGGPDYGRDAG